MISAMLIMAAAVLQVPLAPSPFVDGRCEDTEWRNSVQLGENSGHSIRAMHDRDFLYLCSSYPKDSLGMVDLYVSSPKERAPIDIHASAKLGERVSSGGRWPQYVWWNEQGWSTQLDGFDAMAEGRPVFHAPREKEFQLSLARFGKGEWRIMAEALDHRDGSIVARLPQGANRDDLTTYLRFNVR